MGSASREGVAVEVVARGLVKTFGATVALRGVNARFVGGEVTLVEGANGSGKSTLLRVVGTALRPTSGSVSYGRWGTGAEVGRALVGWVSHETLAYGDMSARQNVELAARLHGLGASDAWDGARERFELRGFGERPVRSCSRGQRQRVALARALVHRPPVVLLDEPTAGLDRQGVERLKGVVGEEAARGAAVVVVTHEPGVFEKMAAARVVLERGRVVRSERMGNQPRLSDSFT